MILHVSDLASLVWMTGRMVHHFGQAVAEIPTERPNLLFIDLIFDNPLSEIYNMSSNYTHHHKDFAIKMSS